VSWTRRWFAVFVLTVDRFTYAISFVALLSATAGFLNHWDLDNPEYVRGFVMFFLVPAVLVGFNTFGVQVRYNLTQMGKPIMLTTLSYMD
jgi:hypothetical protein